MKMVFNFKSRSRSKFSYICCILAQLASTQSFCLWSLERVMKVVCYLPVTVFQIIEKMI